MDRNKIMDDNNGFSLIELIVTVLITAILMFAVTTFISSSRTTYQAVNTSATLQEEAMTVERVFSEALMEAKVYGLESLTFTSGSENIPGDVLWIRAKENDDKTATVDSIYCFVLDKNKEQVRYYKHKDNPDYMVTGGSITSEGKTKLESECFGTNSKYSLIADHVKSMTMSKIARPDGTDLVCMEIKLEYMGKTYTENLTTVTRNITK